MRHFVESLILRVKFFTICIFTVIFKNLPKNHQMFFEVFSMEARLKH